MRRLLTLILLVLAALLAQGMQFDTTDQAIHLTILRQLIEPGALAGDLVAREAGAHHSLFWVIQAPLVRAVGWAQLPELYTGLYIAALTAWFAALLHLAEGLRLPRPWLAAALLVVPRACPGHVFTWEPELINRTATAPALIFAMSLLIRGRPALAGLVAGLAFNLHATTAAHTVAALGFGCLLDPALRRRFPWLVLAFFAGAAPLLLTLPGAAHGEALVDPAWMDLLRWRMPHHLLPLTWPVGVWVAAFAQLQLMKWGLENLHEDVRRRANGLAAGLLVVAVVLGTLAPFTGSALLLQLHLWEAWIGIAVLASLTASAPLEWAWRLGGKARLGAVLVVLAMLFGLDATLMHRARGPVWRLDDPERAAIAAAVADNSPEGAPVLVAPNGLEWVRWRSGRPLYITVKDGGEAVFSRDLAMDWRDRMVTLCGQDIFTGEPTGWLGYEQVQERAKAAFDGQSPEALTALATRIHASVWVLPADHAAPAAAERALSTPRWTVWRLPAPAESD